MKTILPVIMCGGSGTRVWPESRETLPKQFIPLIIGERSTFHTTMAMLADPAFERPIVVSNFDYRFLIADQLRCALRGHADHRRRRRRHHRRDDAGRRAGVEP
ncbi:sugar phosphate nucleotidyltransferase [Methylocystis sp.]|uniref:sugar phosphate nucleotidyltransferase n=1 Tax=Methylocystis sp. TaxID=1911079 RepID=UPI003DA3F228